MGNTRPLAIILALTASACGDDRVKPRPVPVPPSDSAAASNWEIGPVIRGRNHSLGLPLRPSLHPEGLSFAISATAQPHYVTFYHGPLTGKSRIAMTYRVEGEADAVIHGAGCATAAPSGVNLYFQRAGDDWQSNGYRWWATFAKVRLTGPGTYVAEAALDGPWTTLGVEDAAAFRSALTNVARVGFTFSNCEGQGHGAAATKPVTFIVTSFKVE